MKIRDSVELNRIADLIGRNALFVVNHSGGKDSQAMLIKLHESIPDDQLLVIHAELPGADWEGTEAQVYEDLGGLPAITVKAGKTFFDMVEHRQMFPSPKYRQCTSDLKRDPINKAILHYLNDHPEFGGQVVSCMGIRSEESSARAQQVPFQIDARNSKAAGRTPAREWYKWNPIQEMLVGEVFQTIADAGQEPHWAYAAGMTRLSCCFCIMASSEDLRTAAKLKPDLYRQYVELEREIGFTMMMPKKGVARYLPEITGIEI